MNVPKTGAELREEIEATLLAAHERRVDLDALADNVESKLKERETALVEQRKLQLDVNAGLGCHRQHGYGRDVAVWTALIVGGLMFTFGVLLGGVAQRPADRHTAPPYRQAYFTTLRADAERVCAADTANYNSDGSAAGYKVWLMMVDVYIADQTRLERDRHIIAPNYQDMGNVVCPSN